MNAAADIDERLRRFSTVQARILEATQQVVAPENLKNMIIYQATGLGIKSTLGDDGYQFEPELLGTSLPRRTRGLNGLRSSTAPKRAG